MILTFGLLALSLVIILAACGLFTEGVEWIGKKYDLGEGAVGSVLAAVGTALPETLIPIVAFIFAHVGHSAHDIGIGAILGAPLLLSTLAFFITGLSVLIFIKQKKRHRAMKVNYTVFGRDLNFFFIVYLLAILASGVHFLKEPLSIYLRWIIAVVLVSLYLFYIRLSFVKKSKATDHSAEEELGPLKLFPKFDDPRKRYVFIQTFIGLALIILGADFFVKAIEQVAEHFHISALALSLIIAPIATELPEKFNSVIWVSKGKDTLALGNISGAMVFQSSIVPAVGMIFTDWTLDNIALGSAVTALVASGVVWIQLIIFKRVTPLILMFGGLFYVAYLIWLLPQIHPK